MARVLYGLSPVLVLATASLLSTFSSVYYSRTVGQYIGLMDSSNLLAFQIPI